MKKESESKTQSSPEGKKNLITPKRNRVFNGEFPLYWHFVKVLSEEQRKTLAATLSKEEQLELLNSFKEGGWNHLFMRNACDQVLDQIKEKFGIDWLELRTKILKGKPQLVQKGFWNYLYSRFDQLDWDHISYIFDGLIAHEYDAEYVKISMFDSANFIDETENDSESNDTKGE
jgi:hypothetical protein